jgi:hypothetical protein
MQFGLFYSGNFILLFFRFWSLEPGGADRQYNLSIDEIIAENDGIAKSEHKRGSHNDDEDCAQQFIYFSATKTCFCRSLSNL